MNTNKKQKKPSKEDIKHLIKTAEKYSAYSKIKDYFMLIEKEEAGTTTTSSENDKEKY